MITIKKCLSISEIAAATSPSTFPYCCTIRRIAINVLQKDHKYYKINGKFCHRGKLLFFPSNYETSEVKKVFFIPDTGLFMPSYRKPKRVRTAFSPTQLLRLEHAFEKNHYVVGQERKELSASLNLSETQVNIVFYSIVWKVESYISK